METDVIATSVDDDEVARRHEDCMRCADMVTALLQMELRQWENLQENYRPTIVERALTTELKTYHAFAERANITPVTTMLEYSNLPKSTVINTLSFHVMRTIRRCDNMSLVLLGVISDPEACDVFYERWKVYITAAMKYLGEDYNIERWKETENG